MPQLRETFLQELAKDKSQNAVGYGTFNNRNLNLFLLSTGSGYGMITDKSGKETFMAMGSLGGGLGNEKLSSDLRRGVWGRRTF